MENIFFYRVFHRLLKYWSNIKLVQRLIIGCFVFLVIPVLTVGIILFSIVLPLAQNEGRDSLVGMVNQMNENVQFRVIGYQNILAQLALDPRLSATLTQEYSNLSDAVDGLQSINSLVQRINAYFPMRRICIYQDNPTLPEDLGNIYKLSRVYNETWYKSMSSSPTKNFYWYLDSSTPGDSVLDLSVRVKDFMEYENNTIIVFQIPCNTLFNQMQNPLQEKQGWVMLLDHDRQLLADCQAGEAGEFVKEEPYLDSVYKNDSGWIFTQIGGKRSLVVYKTNNLGWKIISVVSQEALWHKIQLIRNVVILVSILFVVLSVFVLAAFGLNITKRLKRLLKSMHEVRKGNFGMQVALNGNDELTAVESEFNAMTRQLDVTLKDLAETRSWADQEEHRVLQAEMNPHFLYNTLALVKYMAMDIDAKDICGIIDAISRFFRLALNRGIDVLKVKEELEHVQAYLEIHELRFPNRVTTTFEIDPQILDYTIIKMTLQPIVENVLTHAFVKTSGCGIITITAGQADDMLFLRVADNGCGMTDEVIEELLNGPYRDDKRKGFGVRNVHERLKRYYGDPYGLKIKSTIDAGTVVEISVPFHLAGDR